VPLVMASHAVYPSLDPDAIASQSSYVLQRLLRQRLGFRGVIVTDSIEAKAVTERSGPAVAAVRSVRAGADLVLTTGPGSHLRVLRALLAEARRSPAFRRRVEESAARVLALKRELGLHAPRQ
jgi:beta-N-acetylhexosaminidase